MYKKAVMQMDKKAAIFYKKELKKTDKDRRLAILFPNLFRIVMSVINRLLEIDRIRKMIAYYLIR
jgi:hypothetical protein